MRVLSILALALVGGCLDPIEVYDPCASRPSSGPRASASLVPVGWSVSLTASASTTECAPWTIVRRPDGSNATLETDADRVTLVPDTPGLYEVGFRTPSWGTLSVEIEAFASTIQIVEKEAQSGFACSDAAPLGDRLACVGGGLRIVDEAGGVLSQSTLTRPLAWGVDAAGDLVATASTGCAACPPCCSASGDDACEGLSCLTCCTTELSPGVDLYRVASGGGLEHLWRREIAADEVSLADGVLAVSTEDRTEVFDVEDPTAPELLGCVDSPGLPLFAEGRLWLLGGALTEWALPSVSDSCTSQPLRSAPAGRSGEFGWSELVEVPGAIFASAAGFPLRGFVTEGGSVQEAWSESRIDARRLALVNGRLVVRSLDRLYVFDVSEPRAPRPIAMVPHEAGIVGAVIARGDDIVLTSSDGVRRYSLR